jgi:DNA (cytosine-5)-methyltransferase 1
MNTIPNGTGRRSARPAAHANGGEKPRVDNIPSDLRDVAHTVPLRSQYDDGGPAGAIRFFDMFSGIGGFREGLERAGGFRCTGHCEIDPYANEAYQLIHKPDNKEFNHHDATTINPNEMPDFDLLCAGFPCQAFSIAGKRKGFTDHRGVLFFEIARLAGHKKPAYLLLENVPGLLSHEKGETFAAILHALSELGYYCEWQVLNSKDFGLPQGRKRLFIVGYLDNRCAGQILPVREASEEAALYRATEPAKQPANLYTGRLRIKNAGKQGYAEAEPGDSVYFAYLNSVRRGRVCKRMAHTLVTGMNQAVVTEDGRLRRFTPAEALRLQGFSEEHIQKLVAAFSDTRLYRMAGNAVSPDIVHVLGRRLQQAHYAPRQEENGHD